MPKTTGPRRIPVVLSRGGIVSYGPASRLNASLLQTVARSTGSELRCATLGLANAHLVRNKADLLTDHVLEHNVDLVALSETWLSADANDKKTISDLTAAGYDFAHIPRPERKGSEAGKQRERKERGGGVRLLFRSSLKVTILPKRAVKTFEHMDVIVRSSGGSPRLVTIYRPPPSNKNGFSTADFLADLPDFSRNSRYYLFVSSFWKISTFTRIYHLSLIGQSSPTYSTHSILCSMSWSQPMLMGTFSTS